jgi:hypothetical protein
MKYINDRFILKTIADCLVAGLISVGVFQSPTFAIKSFSAYATLIGLVLLVLFLIVIYALRSGEASQERAILGLFIALSVSIVEVFLIGFTLGYGLDIIAVVWFITIPSVIIFDKILG